jgi:outer membrane protein
MNRFSTILNIFLLVAVIVLYYLHFSASNSKKSTIPNLTNTSVRDSAKNYSNIAYVELDSLKENITFMKEGRRELEIEQKAVETNWNNGIKSLENQRNNFLKKGSSVSQEDAQEFQIKFAEQQQTLEENRQVAMQKLNEKNFKFIDDMQKKLKEFLSEYNSEKKFQYILTNGTGLEYLVYKDTTLNITNDVIKGMNEKLKAATKQ